jgi:hypothetical protein
MNTGIKPYIEQLNLIYYSLLALPLVLFPVVYLPIKESTTSTFDQAPAALYSLAAILLFMVIFFGRRLFRQNLSVIRVDWVLQDKLRAYRKALLIFYLLGMFSCLVSVGLLMFTRHQLFVATYPVLLLILSLYRPTIDRMRKEIPLSEKDLSVIQDQG